MSPFTDPDKRREYSRDYNSRRRKTEVHGHDLEVRRATYDKNPEPHRERARKFKQRPDVKLRTMTYMKEWRAKNQDKVKACYERNRLKMQERHRLWAREMRASVIQAYGGKCTCCGETELAFLALDHVHNDGKEHRRQLGGNGIYIWAKRNGYPERLQVLCNNCNLAKERLGICPHQAKKLEVAA